MWNIKSTDQESGETAQALRAVAPFAEDLNSVPNTHMAPNSHL